MDGKVHITLEQLLRMEVPFEAERSSGTCPPDFRVAVQEKSDKGVRIIVHANGHSSETLDFWVSGNQLLDLPDKQNEKKS